MMRLRRTPANGRYRLRPVTSQLFLDPSGETGKFEVTAAPCRDLQSHRQPIRVACDRDRHGRMARKVVDHVGRVEAVENAGGFVRGFRHGLQRRGRNQEVDTRYRILRAGGTAGRAALFPARDTVIAAQNFSWRCARSAVRPYSVRIGGRSGCDWRRQDLGRARGPASMIPECAVATRQFPLRRSAPATLCAAPRANERRGSRLIRVTRVWKLNLLLRRFQRMRPCGIRRYQVGRTSCMVIACFEPDDP